MVDDNVIVVLTSRRCCRIQPERRLRALSSGCYCERLTILKKEVSPSWRVELRGIIDALEYLRTIKTLDTELTPHAGRDFPPPRWGSRNPRIATRSTRRLERGYANGGQRGSDRGPFYRSSEYSFETVKRLEEGFSAWLCWLFRDLVSAFLLLDFHCLHPLKSITLL